MNLFISILLISLIPVKSEVFTFTRNTNSSLPNKELRNHVLREFSTKFQITHCAMECFRFQKCKSFNYAAKDNICQLNDATHEDFPSDLHLDDSGKNIEYHVRGAFSIDSEAVGPCGSYPCQNDGRCLDTKSTSGQRMYICYCSDGWTGQNCHVKERTLEWASWEDWGTCSVSCEYGYQTRRRQCEDINTGDLYPSTECYGRDVEHKACVYKDCPRWEEWSKWGECSTYTTCGRGYKIRHRNCSNDGVPGVDRYCKGPGNESSVCEGVSCKGMIRLVDGPTYGEGRVEMYHNINQMWLQVCSDNWSLSVADIVCKQTGFQAAHQAITDGRYDKNSTIDEESVTTNCTTGSELTLHQCVRTKSNCSLKAGVQCKVKGVWSLWTSWSNCSVTCENGTRIRTRECNHPPANHGGTPCPGDDTEYKHCGLPMCPIDGVWSLWTEWSACSVTCANGTQYRTRKCTGPFYGGKNCDGNATEITECFPEICPVDGIWNDWVKWTECTVTCGYGTRTRDRTCHGPFYKGTDCVGDKMERESCNAFSCPVDGDWLLWTNWGQCNVSCGGGIRNRTRECNLPKHGGKACEGTSMETETCNQHSCAVDGVWKEWSVWTDCSVTCANGTRSRDRTCEGPLYGGKNCSGDWSQIEVCMTESCPVDGVWQSWSKWDECNVTCGGGGQNRYRICIGPFFGGMECNGSSVEPRDCNMHPCPIDGVWFDWSNWTECSLTCGRGVQSRNRTCDGPFYGGQNCTGDWDQVRDCNTHNCPVDGYWENWSNWTSCNVSCGGGHQWRTRQCEPPKYGGAECDGVDLESLSCNKHNCPIDGVWEEWNAWTICTLTCGNGTRTRNRTCDGPFYGGEECNGPSNETELCNTFHCPVDGIWTEWSDWEQCSRTCGRGITSRNRTCIGPFYGGKPCDDPSEETKVCNVSSCAVDGEWLPWETWSACDASCGSGTRYRKRNCDGPYDGGKECIGPGGEAESCSESQCPVDGVYTSWSKWTECAITCGGAIISRDRFCVGPFFGGQPCKGAKEEQKECASMPCPVDGEWSFWSSWTACNVTCGGGYSKRYRYCSDAEHGGSNCTGDAEEFKDCNTNNCPVDGIFGSWSEWGDCSLSCGTGDRWRNRTCNGPYYGGNNCTGLWEEQENCNTQPCPVDGIYDEWSDWTDCTTSCGGGTRDRKRKCIGPFHGGANCSGPAVEQKDCNMHHCPVDGKWEVWSSWESCNVTCGGGIQWRHRGCDGPFYGGQNCTGPYIDNQECNTQECPVDGTWMTWSSWSWCSVSCGGGIQNRSRDCEGPYYGGLNCEGDDFELQDCNSQECPVDGTWIEWSNWESCSVSCGGGNQSRYRTCHGPFFGGQNCTGIDSDTQDCNTHPCPIDGILSDWSEWYTCNVTCGGGIQLRNRSCVGPFYGGSDCSGDYLDSKSCNEHHCPVDGQWIEWSDWKACNVTCGGGIQWRYRECDGPYYGGLNCSGENSDNQLCNENPCPVDGIWADWMEWQPCDMSCGGGIQLRHRNCTGPFYGGSECAGHSKEDRICNTHLCPVDGKFTDWSDWGTCDVTCGGGIQWRSRTCDGPFHGGAPCKGNFNESQDCNINPCPVDGLWTTWSEWGNCDVSCGGGSQLRSRSCHGQSGGGLPCKGSMYGIKNCNSFDCPEWANWEPWGQCSSSCGGGTQIRSRQCDGPAGVDVKCKGAKYGIKNCNFHTCPVDGVWKAWSSWDDCSVTCGGGYANRSRICTGPYYGGKPCEGNSTELMICGTDPCPIPGDWLEWASWSLCSVTCDGGKRSRSRACNDTSYGDLTAPCSGDATEEVDCHTFSCESYPKHCTELKNLGLIDSAYAEIDPLNKRQKLMVYCDMEAENGAGVTVIGHNREVREQVLGYEGAGSYSMELHYNLSKVPSEARVAAEAVVDTSEHCSQHLRWECKGSVIHNPRDNSIWTTYWVGRTGANPLKRVDEYVPADYFPGGEPGSFGCACAINQSCADPTKLCNCDKNDHLWRKDEGNVTVKSDLPIIGFFAGDTGDDPDEQGAATVGRLICYGDLT